MNALRVRPQNIQHRQLFSPNHLPTLSNLSASHHTRGVVEASGHEGMLRNWQDRPCCEAKWVLCWPASKFTPRKSKLSREVPEM